MNYVGVISNSVAVVTTAVSLIRESRENAVKANDAVENSPADSGFFHIEANLKMTPMKEPKTRENSLHKYGSFNRKANPKNDCSGQSKL